MQRRNDKEIVIDYDNSIKKSNEISMAKLNQGLALNQMQLLAFAIFCTQKDGRTEFHKADFERKFGLERYNTKKAKQDVPKLSRLQFSTVDLEAEIVDYLNVFQRIRYEEGLFIFKWSEDMIPHILNLQDHYLTNDLGIASQFKSSFSWTLYDYLKSHYGYWHKYLSKDALMKLFGISENKSYQSNTGLIKKKVLDVAIAELNQFTELKVWYEEKKEGRAITGFELHWSTGVNIEAATKAQLEELDTILKAIEKDMFVYIDLEDKKNLDEAKKILKESREMQDILMGGSLTKDYVTKLLLESKRNLHTLERLLEKDQKKIPEFYNWLEQRD